MAPHIPEIPGDAGQLRGLGRVPEFDHQWTQCNACRQMLYRREVERNLMVCPKCNYHFVLGAHERLVTLLDADSFEEYDKLLDLYAEWIIPEENKEKI